MSRDEWIYEACARIRRIGWPVVWVTSAERDEILRLFGRDPWWPERDFRFLGARVAVIDEPPTGRRQDGPVPA